MAFRGGRGHGSQFQKPENALKRAEELIAVGQKGAALQTLHDVITSKRHRTWQKVLEQIMFRYVDLCVELKKGRYAKDGLIHYRNVCQQVNVSSLEEVIKYLLKSATDKAEDAESKAAESVTTLDVEDLEVDATPEDLMLSYVSGEKGKDRADRELVTPWFKFLWETYRTILDILRNNSRLEALYAMTAARAFQFCLSYKRATEFRRLTDILRNHLANLNKYRDQRDRPDLSNPESLQLYLETRFEQLKVACELELWQEAFRSVEDIQGLIAIGKKSPKPQLMATYYARLTRIFTVADSHLYNGYAWYKLFNLARGYNKNLTPTDVQMMACSVVLAALSILPYDPADSARTEAEAELDKDRSVRMAVILGFTVDSKRDARSILSRAALVQELSAKGILSLVPEEVRAIHTLLESDFNPLELCKKLSPLLDSLDALTKPMSSASPVSEAALGQYRKSLQTVAVLRLLQQLSQVYSTLSINTLTSLLPFLPFTDVEHIIVEAVKHNFVQVSIDHKNGTVHFGGYQLEREWLREQMANLGKRLTKVVTLVQAGPAPERVARRKEALLEAANGAERDNKRALARKELIEKRKEEQERLLLEAEKEEEEKRLIQARLNEAAEEERRRIERLKREEERLQKELKEREDEEARKILEDARKKGRAKGIKDVTGMGKEQILNEVMSENMKARQEAEARLNRLIKLMDHLERARREEEAPLLQAAYEKKLEEDRIAFEEEQVLFRQQHRSAWELDVQEKQRLEKMLTYKEHFANQIMTRRAEEFAALKRQREARIAEKREARKKERAIMRRQEYARRCRIEIEERRRKEEEERQREEEERRKKEEEERKRKMDELAEKQRKKEEEIEARRKQEMEALKDRPSSFGNRGAKPAAFVPPAARSADVSRPADAADRWTRSEAPPAAAAARPADDGGSKAESAGAWRPRRLQGDEPPRDRERDRDWGADRQATGGGGGGGGAWRPSRRTESRDEGPPNDPRANGRDRWAPRPGPPGRDDPRPSDRAPPSRERW